MHGAPDSGQYPGPNSHAHLKTAMFAIIGIIVTFGAVLGGYLMEHGNVKVLLQPAELLIIGGAAAGTVLIGNPLHVLKQIAGGMIQVFNASPFTRKRYLPSLQIGYQLLNKARRPGLMSLETDVEDPDNSAGFGQDPGFLKDPHVVISSVTACAWQSAASMHLSSINSSNLTSKCCIMTRPCRFLLSLLLP